MPWLAVKRRAGVSVPPRSVVSRALVASSASTVPIVQPGAPAPSAAASGAWGGGVSGHGFRLRLARVVTEVSGILPEVLRPRPRCLSLPVLQHGRESLADGRVGIMGEDDTPSGLGQVPGIHPFNRGE